ncbi:hypothetical protein [Nocardia salmonicida]
MRTKSQATAWIPRSLFFDSATGEFRYTYAPDRLIPDRDFVSPPHYTNGAQITVDGGSATSSGHDIRMQIIAEVQVRSQCAVCDGGGGRSGCVSARSPPTFEAYRCSMRSTKNPGSSVP